MAPVHARLERFQATFLVVAVVALAGFVVTVLFVGRRQVDMARPSSS